jgi:predicted DNA-binding ribbon-helix-helix protein
MYENEEDTRSQFSPSANTSEILEKYKTNIPKKRAISLKSICPDAGFCMDIGKQSERIKKHFDGFVNFKYAVSPVKNIGEKSVNGFVKEITYEREGYKANAILKSPTTDSSDNLIYEYLVGQYINKKFLIFPCFVETYGWYKYKSRRIKNEIKTTEYVTIENLKDSFEFEEDVISEYKTIAEERCYQNKKISRKDDRECSETEFLLKIACKYSTQISILTQHINNAKNLTSMLRLKCLDINFSYNDLINVLYQIYMPLASLSETLTHYDLHTNNVLIYEPVPGKYIDYRYMLNDGSIVEFKCRYIAKIIDYGRCFFKDDSNPEILGSSELIYNAICENIPECDGDMDTTQNCGEEWGFETFNKDAYPEYYINTTVRNTSHDLLLLYQVKKMCRHHPVTNPLLQTIFDKLHYGEEEEFGSVEKNNVSPLIDELPEEINNVMDAHNALKKQVMEQKSKNDLYDLYYNKLTSLGVLTIYQNGGTMDFNFHK